MGWTICSRHRTAPQLAFSSMMHASRVTRPSRSGAPPRPTVVFLGSASGTLTPCSTASNALPFAVKTFHASTLASLPKFQVEITIGPPAGKADCEGKAYNEARAALVLRKRRRDDFILIR